MKKKLTSLATVVGALVVAFAISSCSGHGPGGACIENMPGMIMCNSPQSLQVAPSLHASH
jgi:hypothetical protein